MGALDTLRQALTGFDRDTREAVIGLARRPPDGDLAVEKTTLDTDPWYGKWNPDSIPVGTYLKMTRDPDIEFGLYFILCPLYQVQSYITKSSGDPQVDALVLQVLDRNWFSLTRSSFWWSVVLGYATHEQLWAKKRVRLEYEYEGDRITRETDAWVIAKYKDLPQEQWQTRVSNPNGHFRGFYWGSSADEEDLVPPEKAFIHTRQGLGQSMFGVSRLRAAYVPWWIGGVISQLRRQYAELRAGGVLDIGYPPSVTTTAGELRGANEEDPHYSDEVWGSRSDRPRMPRPRMDRTRRRSRGRAFCC